ncbi:MAG: Na+/H+ antiporter subunit E [Candidatus Krumholzibacteriia bacterium]
MASVARLGHLAAFLGFYAREVVLSNLRVARDILSLRPQLRPGILAVPVSTDLTDRQLLILASLITMTPGTLSLEVADDRSTLFIHTMYLDDPVALRDRFRNDYEERIRRVF